MRAIVLAAGFGVRFRPATAGRPKALLPHLNLPLIDRRLSALRRAGVSETAVNLHHEGVQIVEHLGQAGRGDGVVFFDEPEILGTAGAVKNAEQFLREGDFLVWNVDAEIEPDIASLQEAHRSGGARVTLLAAPNPDPARFTPVFADAGRVIRIGGQGESPLVFTGVSVHSPDVLARIESGFRSFVDDLWRPMLENHDPIGVAIHGGPFFDLGTPEDLHRASMSALETQQKFEPGEGHFDRDDQVLSLAPVRQDGLRRSVLGRVGIAPGCRIENSVLWDGASVEAGASAVGCLVGPVRLPSGRVFRDTFLWPQENGAIREIPLHSHFRPPEVK